MTSGRDTSTNSGGGNTSSANNNSRLSRISFRPRPIDVTKKMEIIRDVIDDDQNAMSLLPILPTGMEPQEEEESHLQEIIQASQRVRHDQLPEIPIPVVKVVDGYDDEHNPHPYQHQNSTYILHQDKTDQEMDIVTEYDLDSDDEDLVNEINKKMQATPNTPKKSLLSLDRFESIIDRFEKELYYYGTCDPTKAETICKGIKQCYATQIFQYWLNKKKYWRNSMVRRLLKPPDREDPSPYKAFRPREENPNKQKKARKNDAASLEKMQQLRQEFERARTVLEMIKKREKLKKDEIVVYQQIYEQLLELAKIRSTEEALNTPIKDSNSLSSSTSGSNQKKKKDQSAVSISSTGSSNSSGNLTTSSYLSNHNYPGPAFASSEGQQVLSNGKARQEGYRHYVPKQGQFPTPTIDKQYSAILGLNSSGNTTSPLSKPVGGESSLSPINIDSGSGTTSSQLQQSTSSTSSQQVVPVIDQDLSKEKSEKEYNDYFNSISIPTCSNYYDDDDYNDSDNEDQSFGPNSDQTGTTFYDPNIIPQPKLNAQGQPIYPSFNQGYIFLDPNYPPVLGKVRAGRYGGTYIDFLPIEKTNSFSFYQNQLKLFNQKLQSEQESLLKKQLHQQLPPPPQIQQLPQTQQTFQNLQQLPSSPSLSTSHLNSPSIDTQCNNNIIDNSIDNIPLIAPSDVVMEPITNTNITNNTDTSINEQQQPLHINSLKRKLNSNGVESSPTKKLLITDFDGFTPIPSSVVDNNGNGNNNNTNSNSNGITIHSPSLTKSLKYSTKSNKARLSSNSGTSPTIEQYFTKKLSPTT